MAIDGVITQNSVLVRQGGRMVRLPITRTPIVALTPLGAALADLLVSGVEPCPVCDKFACQCPNPDPHGNLAVFAHEEIPY